MILLKTLQALGHLIEAVWLYFAGYGDE